MERKRSRLRSGTFWLMLAFAALLAGRLAYGAWLVHGTNAAYVANDDDLARRLAATTYLEIPTFDPAEEPPAARALLALVNAVVGNILVSPAVFATLCAVLLLAALAGTAREMFPEVGGAPFLTIALLGFHPALSQLTLTARPESWTAAICSLTIWVSYRMARTGRNSDRILYCCFMILAYNSSFDAWLLLLPLWFAAFRTHLRRPAAERNLASWLAHGLAAAPVAVWCVVSLAAPGGPAAYLTNHFGLGEPRAPDGAFSEAVASLAITAPLTMLLLPMLLVARPLAREGYRVLRRPLALGLLLLLISIYHRSGPEEATARLLVVVALLVPSIAGATLLVIRYALQRVVLARAVVWTLALGQLGVSLPHGLPRPPIDNEAIRLGVLLRSLYREGVVDPTQELVAIQNRAHNEELEKPQKLAISASAYTQLFHPGAIRMDHLIPIEMDALAPRSLRKTEVVPVSPRAVREMLERQQYRLIVAVGPNTRRVLQTAGYKKIGEVGPYALYTLLERPALNEAVKRFTEVPRLPAETS